MAEQIVKLSCDVLKKKDVEYAITHAQALLDLEKGMGVENWKLTDKQFMLNNNGIIQRANNKPNQRTEGEGSIDKGSEA